ncbi:MAG TPA: hypothetical protein VEU51_17365 [Candidatus Acidoferrales bacterium]|nr:hypothetical protein [Candidatus Acidoferrales bacterium]
MRSRQNLTAALVGIAMLATPIAAAAKDHGRNFQNNVRAARAARTFAAPARTFTPAPVARRFAFRNVAPVVIPVNRVNRAARFNPNFVPPGHLHARGWNRNWNNSQAFVPVNQSYDEDEAQEQYNATPAVVCDEDGDDCRAAGGYQGGYYPNYGYNGGGYQGGYGSGACIEAQRLQQQVRRDRATGHPAAANDVLRKMARMERACGGAPVGGGLLGGLRGLGGLNGLGGPAYNNYGYNSGYNGGYNQPYYNNGYGSTLAPLIQQFFPH